MMKVVTRHPIPAAGGKEGGGNDASAFARSFALLAAAVENNSITNAIQCATTSSLIIDLS